jgi:uncharacterized membrane protein
MNSDRKLIFRYRLSLGSFISGLIVSGLTAFPLELETALLNRLFGMLIDCSFGIVGAIPLLYCLRLTRKIDNKL